MVGDERAIFVFSEVALQQNPAQWLGIAIVLNQIFAKLIFSALMETVVFFLLMLLSHSANHIL